MGSMSASDAAPLPRLGEVFFDVRGSSRSMRLSWYADTAGPVLRAWIGGWMDLRDGMETMSLSGSSGGVPLRGLDAQGDPWR